LVRQERLDWILPVGGGSVLDGAKFVAAAAPYSGDPWEILTTRGAKLQSALPIGAVLTLPGTGSEANGASVISRRALREKLAFISPLVFPRFSVLDPETTFTLPERQIANGVADAFTHVMEQYLTYPTNAAVQDRFAEAVMRVLIDEGPKSVKDPSNYDARANVVWAATWALNGAIGAGVPQDWASHMIGHELTALHGIDHARTLAVELPSLLNVQRGPKGAKLLQYGERVWGITGGSEAERMDAAIARTRGFYEALGLRTRLSDYQVPAAVAGEVAGKLRDRGLVKIGERGDITPEVVEKILREAA
jgi:NADP-dependent alcohol dehydrogenase